MSKKLFIKTWGCQMNEYDSSRIADLLAKTNACVPCDIPESAEILLLN
ncbi:MAG: tRNA (N6-isopentenyl adenosine(37)-C2)-methylthiotransferase MiaB, partial [Gammaproteobacteria bacterium]|nr:tRNA (N6-isopentenyl adenosine(37)-C2)-methylthiotransferase MiaB [Gammaproteobacteria bacterium]